MGRKTRYAEYKMRSVSAKFLHSFQNFRKRSDSFSFDFGDETGTPDTKNPSINVIYNKQHRKQRERNVSEKFIETINVR